MSRSNNPKQATDSNPAACRTVAAEFPIGLIAKRALGCLGANERFLLACRLLVLCVVSAAGPFLFGLPSTLAGETRRPNLRIDLSEKYDLTGWQGENTPVFHTTADGEIVLLPGQNSYGKSAHALASSDGGKTWRNWTGIDAWPLMAYDDVIRRGNELLAFGYASTNAYAGTMLWRSSDKGATWTGGKLLTAATTWAPMNQRVLQTSTGRILVPIEQIVSGSEGSGANQVGTIYSDDGGQSWQRSPLIGLPSGYPTTPEGIGEPAVVELPNDKIWMVCRGLGGRLWQSLSTDNGATWTTPVQTTLVSPLSAVNAKRIPGTDAVVAVWNNATPGTSTNWGDAANVWRPRSPLVFAVSEDNCQTWSDPVTIDTGTAAYPSICFSGSEMFVSYWEDPSPTAVYLNANSHLMVVSYDIAALAVPEPATILTLAIGCICVIGYALQMRL